MRTMVIHTWMVRFVRNQWKKVPSGGIICGYCFIFCCSLSLALRGTEKAGCLLRRGRRAGCDGGLKRVGFSSSRPLGTGLELLLAGREATSERTRSEVCGARMVRSVGCRDSWSADIVDMVYEAAVQDGDVDGGGKSS